MSSYSFDRVRLVSYSRVKTEEPEWIWYPYIPLGTVVLLVGDPGVGKSYFALYIASIISNGGKFPFTIDDLNSIKKPSTVLFQNGEDGISHTLSLRLNLLGGNRDKICFIDEREKTFRIDQISDLEDIIDEYKIRLIVIDPVQRYLPQDKSMNSANEVRDALTPLRNLASKYNCTVILVMHKNKCENGNTLYRALGSIDFVGICRSMLSIEEDKKTGKKIIRHIKSSLSEKGKSLIYDIDDDGFKLLGQVEDSTIDYNISKNSRAKNFLRNELAKGPLTNIDIKFRAIWNNISLTTLIRAKKELGIEAVQYNKTWFWSLSKIDDNSEIDKRYR